MYIKIQKIFVIRKPKIKSLFHTTYIYFLASQYEFCFRYLLKVKNVVLLFSPQLLIQTIHIKFTLHFTFAARYQVYV